jgi:hypothetical protein
MANVPAGQPIAPGVAAADSGYPQYGVMQSGSTYTIATAGNETQKLQDANKGYLVWFTSKAAAQNYISSESSLLNGNIPNPLTGVAAIGDFFSKLGHLHFQTILWRAAKILLGGTLLVAGFLKMSGTEQKAYGVLGQAAGKLPGV